MAKKINSEYKIPCIANFNVTGGTTDKKNLQSIYYSIGTYIILLKLQPRIYIVFPMLKSLYVEKK